MVAAALAVLENEEQRNELAEFYKKHKNRFYETAFEHLHNRQDAEDALQETFLRIADKPDKFFSLSNSGQIYFVSAIIRNVSIDMFNKKIKHKTDEIM